MTPPTGEVRDPWRQRLVTGLAATRRRRQATGRPVPPADQPYLVVAVMGQSNAHGAGLPADPDGLDAPHPLVHQWPAARRFQGRVHAATEPLLHEAPGRGIGPGSTFARGLSDRTGQPVLLVPAARGDTSFHPKNGWTWDPDVSHVRHNLFDDAMDLVDSALQVVPGSRLAVVLWHQGESDAPLLEPTVYEQRLDELIGRTRARQGPVPFVLGQMVPESIDGDEQYAAIDRVHASTPSRHADVAFVRGPRGRTNPGEEVHYDAAGQRELGRRYLAAYLALTDAAG